MGPKQFCLGSKPDECPGQIATGASLRPCPSHRECLLVGRVTYIEQISSRALQTFGQLGERFGFDLQHAFTGESQLLSDFLERAGFVVG